MPTKAKDDGKKKRVTKATNEPKGKTTKATVKKTTSKQKEKEKSATEKKVTTSKKTTTKKSTSTKKATATKKSTTAKKTVTKKSAPVKEKEATTRKSTTAKKATATKKSTTAKKTVTKKSAPVKEKEATTRKSTTAKKATTIKKSTTARKTTTTKKATVKKEVVQNAVEYFDLPSNYNQTVVKVLFQTPKKLFVYWDISEVDRAKLLEEHGKDFFYNSTPFLIVKNETKNYSFEIEINDFANSWYFDVPDSKCDYSVELIRKYNYGNNSIQIQTSNNVEVPNNHILFEQNRREIFFINVKNNSVSSRNIANLQFIKHLGLARPITINAFYNKFYDEKDIYNINNPSAY